MAAFTYFEQYLYYLSDTGFSIFVVDMLPRDISISPNCFLHCNTYMVYLFEAILNLHRFQLYL